MAERSDIQTFWEEGPRIVEVAAPSVELTMQDLHDTLKSNTLQASENDDSLDNMDDDQLIDSAGKEDLGGGVLVGITASLLYAQVAFESRLTPTSTGTVTTGDAAGETLIDAAATFIADGVERGAVVINFTDESITEVLEVVSETELMTRTLRAGTDDQFDVSDGYKIWNIIQCDLSGGNIVAVDDVGDPMSAIFPTAFTQIVRTSSSSATLQELTEIRYATYQNVVTVDIAGGNTGTEYPIGTPLAPVDNIPDARAIALALGFNTLRILGDITLDTGDDVSDLILVGENSQQTTITVNPGASCLGSQFTNCRLTGTLDGNSVIYDAFVVPPLNFVEGEILRCLIEPGTITLGGSSDVQILDSWSGVAGGATPIIDYNGSGRDLLIRRYAGGIRLQNKTGSDNVSIDLDSGQVILDADVTSGTLVIRGTGTLTDNSVGATVNTDGLVNPAAIAAAVWNALTATYTLAGSFGNQVGSKLLTLVKWLGIRGGP